MSDFRSRNTPDPELVENGVWVDGFDDGVAVKMRSPSSTKAREALRRIQEHPDFKPTLQRHERLKEATPIAVQDEINMRWMAQGIMVDWRNVPGDSGEMISFTPNAAIAEFKKMPYFHEDCWIAAGGRSQFLPADPELAKADTGN